MSNRFESGDVFVHTGFLREHVSKLRAERKIALELRENVEAMKYLVELDELYRIQAILHETDLMVEYFGKMADSIENISDEATYLSRTMGGLIEDDTENTRNTVRKTFSL